MFVDELTIHLKAGRGGDGVERWRHEKGRDHAGPSGGNGGKGGDVIALAVRDIGILAAYRNVKEFSAGRGEDGAKNVKQGGGGKDEIIKFPVGSRLTNLETGFVFELLNDGDTVTLLHGGRGGLGNEHFKSSTNIRPTETTEGARGEEADFLVELLLAIDVGLVGLPNAGKSSLLNVLTRAQSKVGAFPFTTLEPWLGDLFGLVVGDIPGLIEGASQGKGLGHKFLRHIERTRAIAHCISLEDEDPLESYRIVRKEIEDYNEEIAKKPEVIVLTKSDLVSPVEDLSKKKELLKGLGKEIFALSIIDDESVKKFGEFLTQNFK